MKGEGYRKVNLARLARVSAALIAIALRVRERITEIDRLYPEPPELAVF
jgi:hypothetical protein